MLKLTPLSLSVVILLLAALACVVPGVPTPDLNAIGTSAAQTVIAGLTQNALLAVLSSTPLTPQATFTPEPPTLTPTQTLTATPVFTSTPLFPQISVSVPTNCRNGPGKVYNREGGLLVGEVAEVFARDPTGRYWYIRNPDSPNRYCWVWGEYATLYGNISLLPIYTPPPTPTPTFTSTPSPDFNASYTGLDSCTGWWAEITLKNSGSIPFRSVSLTLRDTVTDVLLSALTDSFTDLNGCLSSFTKDTLFPGNTYVVSAPAFAYNPTGHKIRATITLCSQAGQNGTCVTKTINFTP